MMVLIYFLIFILGSSSGSFAVCCGWRFANSYSLISYCSFCEACHIPLKKRYLVPLIGFLMQGGRCVFCHAKISAISFIVELLFGCYYLFLFALNSNKTVFPFLAALALWSLILAFQDFYSLTISNGLLWLGGFFLLLVNYSEFLRHLLDWKFILFFLIALAFFSYFQYLGLGDLIYIGFLFLLLGFYTTLYIILLGSSCAAFYQFFSLKKKIAFIPFLSLGLLIVLLWSKNIVIY
ncbi:late competence protein ComC [Liquorilactobacillus sucicola DSM 21376 = JCM 15457]|uniref:Prepilin peptidase A24 N-terminal domain-containing protein n=1 Tax=Liquorilactobacillus sucicola DSM 21376 = JCM 15457 TaxID=1423806 RepID=A0A023D078_9LACO|nr:A24 family peptidase [Liquorilactobacillus sucicola]KRN05740.1 hypothetical protein FD15_GL001545 [Liquorilactobacillus sucicola DSM 21376 = JCM 15457]GAJ27211.1 late competence protein ComC [Liquorilactobacillus sucicola DSM 21376 = JCM 15457]